MRTGDKVKITGSDTAIFNGAFPITVANNSTYTYTLPENTAVTSPPGELRSRPVASHWLATSNADHMDTTPRGNNAIIEVSAIAIVASSSSLGESTGKDKSHNRQQASKFFGEIA